MTPSPIRRDASVAVSTAGRGWWALSGRRPLGCRSLAKAAAFAASVYSVTRRSTLVLRGLASCSPSLMLQAHELVSCADGGRRATLLAQDPRVQRLAKGLTRKHAGGGSTKRPPLLDCDNLWCGIADGGFDDSASITWVWPETALVNESRSGRRPRGKRRRAEPKPLAMEVRVGSEKPAALGIPRVDLLLALPRPRQLERMLPHIARMGIGSLFLCGAAKVDAHYFKSHVLEPDTLHQLLSQGAAETQDTRVPRVQVAQTLDELLASSNFSSLPQAEGILRLVAHPGHEVPAADFHELAPALSDVSQPPVQRVLVAVGPEAGWEEPRELDLLVAAGFQCVSVGPRVLRSDVATCALIALAHDLLDEIGLDREGA